MNRRRQGPLRSAVELAAAIRKSAKMEIRNTLRFMEAMPLLRTILEEQMMLGVVVFRNRRTQTLSLYVPSIVIRWNFPRVYCVGFFRKFLARKIRTSKQAVWCDLR